MNGLEILLINTAIIEFFSITFHFMFIAKLLDIKNKKYLFATLFIKLGVFNMLMTYFKYYQTEENSIGTVIFFVNIISLVIYFGFYKLMVTTSYLHIFLANILSEMIATIIITVPYVGVSYILYKNPLFIINSHMDVKSVIVACLVCLIIIGLIYVCNLLLGKRATRFAKVNIKYQAFWWILILITDGSGIKNYAQPNMFEGMNVLLYFIITPGLGILVLYEISLWVRKRQEKLIRQENQILTVENAVMKEYYETLQYQVERTRRFRHDIEKHMNVIKEMIEDSGHGEQLMDYAEHMGQSYDYLKTESYCSNQVLNAILVNKKHQCEENGIGFEIKVDELDIGNIKEMDIVAVLANLLDNAIEECVKLKSQSETSTEGISDKQFAQLRVKLVCSQKADNLIIKIENTTLRKDIDKSVIKTTKKDDFAHGVGLSIVKDIIEKYSGNIEWNSRNNVFSVEVILKN